PALGLPNTKNNRLEIRTWSPPPTRQSGGPAGRTAGDHVKDRHTSVIPPTEQAPAMRTDRCEASAPSSVNGRTPCRGSRSLRASRSGDAHRRSANAPGPVPVLRTLERRRPTVTRCPGRTLFSSGPAVPPGNTPGLSPARGHVVPKRESGVSSGSEEDATR